MTDCERCVNSCAIASALAGGCIWMKISDTPKEMQRKLRSTLPAEKLDAVERICVERMQHCMYGYALGAVVAYYTSLRLQMDPFKTKCFFIAVVLATAVFVYNVLPKSDWILNHIHEREQIDAWLAVYQTCKRTYNTGMLMGLSAYAVIVTYS